MFIKIKLDSSSEFQKDSTLNFIEISNDATIYDLKEEIELFIGIPVDDQVIKSISEILQDHEKLYNICDLEKKEGTSLLLFKRDANFVCFLQLYNDAEAKAQRKFQERSMSPSYYKNMPLSEKTPVNIIDDTDIEENTSGSCGSNDETGNSTQTSETETETDAPDENSNKKRTLIQDTNSVPAKKRLLPLHTQKFLEALPNNTERTSSTMVDADPQDEVGSNHANFYSNIPVDASEHVMPAELNIEEENNYGSVINEGSVTLHSSSVILSPVIQTKTNGNTTSPSIIKPCASIAPEMRKLIVIVTTSNSQEFLKACALEFESSSSASTLQFDDKMPIVLHTDGNLWITCKDENTLAWVLTNLKPSSNFVTKIEKLLHFYQYRGYIVVLPKLQGKLKNLYNQFCLLEHQNTNLNTEKWIVEKQHTIEDETDEYFDRRVSVLSQNVVLFLQIDIESENYVKEQEYKLKYCFWKIEFQSRD